MNRRELIIVLDNIRSRENVGSIFRTADAAGVDKIYLCGITPTPPHEKISKTALGAEMYVPWESCKQTWRLLRKLRNDMLFLIALEQARDSQNVFTKGVFVNTKTPFVIILGNEVKGLSPQILKYCDKKLPYRCMERKRV